MTSSAKLGTLLALAFLIALAFAAAGCSASKDSRAAQAVRNSFVSNGSHPLQGLELTKLSVKTSSGVRTLFMDVVSDESSAASATLTNLVFGGTSDYGWIADLNKTGLGLAFVEIRVKFSSGTIPDELNVIDVAQRKSTTTGGPWPPGIGPIPATTAAPNRSAH